MSRCRRGTTGRFPLLHRYLHATALTMADACLALELLWRCTVNRTLPPGTTSIFSKRAFRGCSSPQTMPAAFCNLPCDQPQQVACHERHHYKAQADSSGGLYRTQMQCECCKYCCPDVHLLWQGAVPKAHCTTMAGTAAASRKRDWSTGCIPSCLLISKHAVQGPMGPGERH